MPARLVLAFGGVSSEHEISIRSAKEVLGAIDRDRFDPIPLGIPRSGTWRTGPMTRPLEELVRDGDPVADLRDLEPDIVFPVLHGPHGEDGTFQGLLEVYGIPYVGSGVLASALCMDKAASKHFMTAHEICQLPWLALDRSALNDVDGTAAAVATRLGYPCFVKPANMGSSVGVTQVRQAADLRGALETALRYDTRIVVEKGIDPREIEVAVLGNGGEDTRASVPGEIRLPPGRWYDYDTKYVDDVATLEIPADLPRTEADRIREMALASFRATGCKGLARVDFLVDRHTLEPYLNELNTMPGFTSISMYPKLMEHAGVPYGELITRLCDLGMQCHEERRRLRVDR
jgi:D-alanine-D-alanine ligase